MLKKYMFIFAILIIGLEAHAEVSSPKLEATYIQAQLQDLIQRTIHQDKFLVQVTVDEKKILKDRILRGETERNRSGEVLSKNLPETLPGFIPPETQSSEKTRKVIQQDWFSELGALHIFLLLDGSVTEARSAEIKEMISARLRPLSKDSVRFTIKTAALLPSSSSTVVHANSMNDYFWWLLAAALGFLVALIAFRNSKVFLSGSTRMEAKNTTEPINSQNPAANGNLNLTENKERLRSQFFGQVLKHPDRFSQFRRSLISKDQIVLDSCLYSPAYLEFSQLNGFILESSQKSVDAETISTWLTRFNDYGTFKDWQLERPIDRIRSIAPAELYKKIADYSDEEISILFPLLTSSQQAHVLDHCDEQLKTIFLNSIKEAQSPQTIASDNSYLINRILSEGFQTVDHSIQEIIRHSERPSALLDSVKDLSPSAERQIRQFLKGIAIVLEMEIPRANELFDKLTNRDLALALLDCDPDDRVRILHKLSPERARLVQSELRILQSKRQDSQLVDSRNRIRDRIWQEVSHDF